MFTILGWQGFCLVLLLLLFQHQREEVPRLDLKLYGGRRARFYQYNEDDFLFEVKLLTRFFRIKSLKVNKKKFFN